MSFGTSGSSNQSWLPGSESYLHSFEPIGTGLQKQYTASGGLNNPTTQLGQSLLQREATGEAFLPQNNPTLAASAAAINAAAQPNIAQATNAANATSQGLGSFGSNKAAQVAGQTNLQGQNALNAQLAQLYGNAYSQGEGITAQAIPQLIQQGQLPYNMALQIAQMLGGESSGGSSSLQIL
jgi:hypothetical protein